jgi:hypothetical protein
MKLAKFWLDPSRNFKFRNYFVAFMDHTQIVGMWSVFSLFNFVVLLLKKFGSYVVEIENLKVSKQKILQRYN